MATSTPPDRRKFLAAAAVVAGLPASSYSRVPGSNARVGVAVIGCGGRGQAHLHLLGKFAGENLAFVAGVCDAWDGLEDEYLQPSGTTHVRRQYRQGLNPSAKQAGLDPLDALRVTKDYRRLLDRADVDAVCVATPDHHHARMTVAALEAGKDVYVERPLARTAAEAADVIAAAERAGRVVSVGVQQLADPAILAAKVILQSKYGPAVAAAAVVSKTDARGMWRYYRIVPQMNPNAVDWPAFLGPDAAGRPFDPRQFAQWRCYSPFAAGALSDLLYAPACKLISAAGWGMPTRVQRLTGLHFEKDGRDVPDSASILAEFPGGGTLTLTASTAGELPGAEWLAGRRGRVHFEKGGLRAVPAKGAEENIKLETPKNETESLWRNFLRCVVERDKATLCPPAVGAAAVAVLSGV